MDPLPTHRPLTQGEIEQGIAQLVNALEDGTTEYRRASENWAEAEYAYKLAFHKHVTRLTLGGTSVSAAKSSAEADDVVAKLHHGAKLAESVLNVVKDAQFSKRARLDALRTLAANVRGLT